MEYPAFVNGSYQSQAVTADAEDTVNLYVERLESPGATSKAALYPSPGFTTIETAAESPGRGHFENAGREFAVIGTAFYEIDSAGVLTNRGVVALDDNPATISSNGDGGNQLFVTSGGNGYIYDLTANTLTQVAALNGKATMGAQIDGYFMALDAATSTLYISDLLDGLTWDPTQFAQRSSAPDPWVAVKVNGKSIWLLGQQTSEVWYNAGSFPFPFAAHPSGLITYGIAAPFSAVVADGMLVWLGATKAGNGFVLRAAGFSPEVVSNFPVQTAINGYATISDAVGDAFNYLGHTFFRLDFPTENVTHVWDSQTSLWLKFMTWISEDGEYVAWRPRFHVFAFGEHRTLDSSTGAVYLMARDVGTDVDGRPIRRLRRAPALMDENQRVYFPGFELDLEPGLGTSTGQGVNPQVMMRLSNDGGKSWGAEVWRSAGAIGEYGRRVRWDRCGMGRRRVFEIAMSDPIPYRITNAYLTPDPIRAAGRKKQQHGGGQ